MPLHLGSVCDQCILPEAKDSEQGQAQGDDCSHARYPDSLQVLVPWNGIAYTLISGIHLIVIKYLNVVYIEAISNVFIYESS